MELPSTKAITETIEQYLTTIDSENNNVEIGFFGGNFTGLPLNEQENYLKTVQPYFKRGVIQGIRLSTRPDYINENILELLKIYNVSSIELGAQSMDNKTLRLSGRGHTSEDIIKASELIKKHGFLLGLQIMLGLPGDTLEKSVNTAKAIVALGADNTRIYPTLVIKDTELEKLFMEKKYFPLWAQEGKLLGQTQNLKMWIDIGTIEAYRAANRLVEKILPPPQNHK